MSRIVAQFWNQVGLMQRFIGLRSGRRDAFERAEHSFTRALATDNTFIAARYNRGLLYWRELNDAKRAITDFTVSLETRPEALFMRGMAYLALGDYRASAADLRTFIEQQPDSKWAGNAYSQLRSLDAILEDLPPQLPDSSDNSALSEGRNLTR